MRCKKGDEVAEGSVIGVVGDSASYEIADAPHLHFELTDGNVQVNPEKNCLNKNLLHKNPSLKPLLDKTTLP
ncbi:MAG: M23 family metallopeptidase [Clostridiales bacterium]|nr:MAG: M23 family metallopeptidase [Clostridiales bacterium]